MKIPKPTNVTDDALQKADPSRKIELDLIQSGKNPTSMTSSLSNHWFPLKGAPSPRRWTDELRLSSPHAAFCLWNAHAVAEEQRKKHLHSTPVTDHPAFILAAGPVTLLIRFLLVQLLMASSIPFLSASLWADTANADGRGLQPSRSQRLETKKAPFVYLYVCLQFSPSIFHGQGFQRLAPGTGTGRNQFSITSEITGHWIISNKSLWRTNPV